ncbi:hypothetical protein FOMPIDRAFT_1036914 [Fomitopsis schrenkii]|uniref:Uncharacterized protein n=1 Tax=Fomitopsis schrenkii TaxID=2126942 RepID=S8E970_FOMSC|nr:hypothetical protein FOMPIDRAFT_1036914 [Fomitopsis schrenkii]
MTTWAYHPSAHPWFREPSLKRKTLEDDDISVVEFPEPRPIAPRPKRRRYDNIEHGLAQMTLNRTSISPPPSASRLGLVVELPSEVQVPPPTAYTEPSPTAYAPSVEEAPRTPPAPSFIPDMRSPIIFPGSVEEPCSPEVTLHETPDVRMKIPHWYEPEKDRIVITDLEDSDTEAEEDAKTGTPGAGYTVSSVLLDRLPFHAPSLPSFVEPDSSKALVLFRPLSKLGPAEQEEERVEEAGEGRDVASDESPMDTDPGTPMDVDDAMDVEPL